MTRIASIYNYHRDYDPNTGRYVQSDPIGLAGGLNTYAYGLGNPLSWFDSRGLEITGTWIRKPHLSNVSVTPVCDANGSCARRPPGILPDFKWWPPSYLAMIAPFAAEGLVSWEIICTDEEECRYEQWTLSGGELLRANIDVPVRLPLASHPVITAARAAQFAARATQLAYEYFEPTVAAYQTIIDPTTWCRTMPRQ